MDMIVNKNNSKSTDLKYIFELQKNNYNEIKMSTNDINLAAKTLTKLLKNDKIDAKEYKILSKAVVSKYIYNEFEEKLDKYFIKSLYNAFRRD
jgi:ABC-type lipoprotein release transport system permease subunit